MADSEFTLSDGHKLIIRPVSPFLLGRLKPAVMREFKVDKALTYIVETVGGGKQEFPHDETTLDVEDDPEQTKINWDERNDFQQRLVLYHYDFVVHPNDNQSQSQGGLVLRYRPSLSVLQSHSRDAISQ